MKVVTALACTIFGLVSMSCPGSQVQSPVHKNSFSDYFLSLTFRESPYAPHLGIHRISSEDAGSTNHFRFDYDERGRITRIDFALGDRLRRRNHTANYFWYASSEHYRYENDRQLVTYFDEWGESTTVHGPVATSEYTLDDQGRRVELRYLDATGEPVESAWAIHKYHWRHLNDGSVIETRFDLEGNTVSLRPGFEFESVRIAYDVNGYTRLMQFVDENGDVRSPANGFAQDRFSHSRHGELLRYDVLNAQGTPTSNHQGIASGLVSFTPRGFEHVATYLDFNGEPIQNAQGWWRAVRRYDEFGNMIENAFEDQAGNPENNPHTGYASAIIDWHEDGLRRHSFTYYDEAGIPISHASRGYHAVRYHYDPLDRLYEIALVDTDENLVERPDQGWAVTRFDYSEGAVRPTEQRYSLEALKHQQLADALVNLREKSQVPGMAAAIAVDGKVVWHGEAGFADVDEGIAVEADTVFRLASVSKAVTSIVTAQRLEDGDLNLQQRVSEVLPVDHQASLGQLLSHTGSVDHYRATINVDLEREYPSSIAALPTVQPHLLNDPPGNRYLYSTFGYTLAGAMLEAVSQKTLPVLVAELAQEYGTPSLAAPIDQNAIEELTRFYSIEGSGLSFARPRNFSYGYAGAGMVSNASDLARVTSLFATGQVVNPVIRDSMLTPARFKDGTTISERRFEVAYGWRRQNGPEGVTWYHHAGVTDGARSIVAISPELGLAVVILSNASWSSDMFGTAATLANLFLAPLDMAGVSNPVTVVHEDTRHDLTFEQCIGATCTWHGEGTGPLTDWLGRDGRGSGFIVGKTLVGNYVASAYGLSWLTSGQALIGSRVILVPEE